jgi:hypothetical protein
MGNKPIDTTNFDNDDTVGIIFEDPEWGAGSIWLKGINYLSKY